MHITGNFMVMRKATYTFDSEEGGICRGILEYDCSLVPESILNEGTLDGFLVNEATSGNLSVTFDKEDYNSHITASMGVEYIKPMKKRKKRLFHYRN